MVDWLIDSLIHSVAAARDMGMLEEIPISFDPEDVVAEFEAMTRDAERVQRETLKRILEENGETEYMQKWGLGGRTDPDSFKACIPLVTHEDLEAYIQRIVDGDNSPILTGKLITTISLTYVKFLLFFFFLGFEF